MNSEPSSIIQYREVTKKLVDYSLTTRFCSGCRKPRSPAQYIGDARFCRQCTKDPYTLYRLRKLNEERGPWYTSQGKPDSLIDAPVPYSEERRGLLSCVDNLDALLFWFKPELPALLSSGFGIFKYTVIGIEKRLPNQEILFSPDKVIEYRTINLEDYHGYK